MFFLPLFSAHHLLPSSVHLLRTYVGLSECLASVEGGALQGEAGRSKAGLLKSLAVRAMSEAEYVSTGTLSDHQASGKGKILPTRRRPTRVAFCLYSQQSHMPVVRCIEGRHTHRVRSSNLRVRPVCWLPLPCFFFFYSAPCPVSIKLNPVTSFTCTVCLPGLEPESQGRFGHFGLGLSHYTHFTSPIRRYADIVVHRLLLASLGVCASTVRQCCWRFGAVFRPCFFFVGVREDEDELVHCVLCSMLWSYLHTSCFNKIILRSTKQVVVP